MRILAFSDIHRDAGRARSLVERARRDGVDVVVGAGDLATVRRGLAEIVSVLAEIEIPAVLVAGNSETDAELREAVRGWDAARVLHGSGTTIGNTEFFGIGGAVPVTPFGSWSYDLTEEEAEERLASCPERVVLVSHSPPRGCADLDSSGRHLGSEAVLRAIERTRPRCVICGHIHASWGARAHIGESLVVNAGPDGVVLEV